MEYTTLIENTKVNYGLWVTMMHQCRFIFGEKCITLINDVDNGGGYVCVGWGPEVHRRFLYISLNIIVNLKLLLKRRA